MPLAYHPAPGAILICDLSTGFRPPEMVKVRPVVVISRRSRTSPLATIIPLSSSESLPLRPWHHRLSTGAYPPARGPMWAKCDVVLTLALDRFARVRVTQRRGPAIVQDIQLASAELEVVLRAVKAGIGLP